MLLLGSKREDFLLHSILFLVRYLMLTNIDLKAAHVLSVKLFLCILCIEVVFELNKGVGSLFDTYMVR